MEGQTATNPETGEKVILQGGQWVPMDVEGAAPPAQSPQAASVDLSTPSPESYAQATPMGESKSLGDEFFSRSTFTTAGGMVGGAIGAPAGPGGVIAGGALGAAAGSATFDNVTNLVNAFNENPEEVIGGREVVENMLQEGSTDATYAMVGSLLQPIRFSRALIGKLSGLTSDGAKMIAKEAERLGIGLGAVDVGSGLPKAAARSIGIFPFSGTPFRTGEKAKTQEAVAATQRLIDDFGPVANMQEIGVDMYAAAKGANKEFRKTAGELYDNFRNVVKGAARQDIIPTQVVRDDNSVGGVAAKARELAEQIEASALRDRSGKIIPSPDDQGAADFIKKLQELPELITPDQYRGLNSDLSDLIQKRIKDGADVYQLTEVKKALEESFASIRTDLLPPGQGAEVKDALDAANSFFSKGITKFQTRAAQSFERVDRFVFGKGAEQTGSLNADELARVAVNLKSPQQIKDLTSLVGKKTMRRAAATHFNEAVAQARQEVHVMGETVSIVDPTRLRSVLGLSGARAKGETEGLKEFYATAGVDLDDVKSLINVIERIEGIGNASEFVRRRMMLGGAGSLAGVAAGVGGGVVAAGATGGVSTAIGLTILARHASKIFADPKKMKLMISAMDDAANATQSRAALARLVKTLVEEDDDMGNLKIEEVMP